ncbi:MAG TPA: protein-disulfide reductase DsbD family protein, partial [Candidatus Kapabacteria bacterium]|nr:protein-disulfide reductase DsbD family protein [Candidatus Kapabacteria bacterium]
MNRLWYSVMLVCVIVSTMTASAIERKRHASVTMNPTSLSVKAGEKASAKFILKLDKHWHTYPQREQLNADGIGPSTTLFSIEPKNIVQFDGTIKDPKGKKHYDAGFEMETESYEGMVTFEIPLLVKPTTKPGTYQIKIISSMQLCDTASCIPPDDYIGTVALTVLDNPDAANTATTADTQAVAAISESPMTEKEKSTTKIMPQQATESTNEQPADTSWATLLLSAFGLGVLSWVMPCVYPMIPITVSFFTKRAEKEHTKPVIDSIVYALGIMATFVIFGVVVAIFFGASAGRDIAS